MSKPAPRHSHRSGGITPPVLLVLALLLALPGYALSRLAGEIDWRVLVGAPVLISGFAFFAYRSDKRSAETGEWRIPEFTLHLVECLGGWPGAFLAQRQFRHKTAKVSFQLVFWLIVLAHQFVAFDSLNDWAVSREAERVANEQLGRLGSGSSGQAVK